MVTQLIRRKGKDDQNDSDLKIIQRYGTELINDYHYYSRIYKSGYKQVKNDIERLIEKYIYRKLKNNEYPKLVMVRDPLHDNVWFKSAGDLSIFKVKYGRLWSYAHLPARVAGQRNRHRISPGHGKHMD
jgi:hypothetical protein